MDTTATTSPDPTLLHGDGRYPFTARIVGDDLVVRGARATWFGGANDPLDDGRTASGVSTRKHPEILGCALPMSGHRVTQGSPLPNLPWLKTQVEVTCPATGKSLTVALIDLGPSAPPRAHAAIDLTVAAFRALGGNLRRGELTVDFRVLGGALHLPPDILLAARSAVRASVDAADPIHRAAPAQGSPAHRAAKAADPHPSPAPALRLATSSVAATAADSRGERNGASPAPRTKGT